MFRTIRLSIIRNLFTVHSEMVYVIQVCRQLSIRTRMEFSSNLVLLVSWYIPLLSVQWINSWWWIEELSETFGVSWQNKFVKLVHQVGFITKKFVTIYGHTNVKKKTFSDPQDFLSSLFSQFSSFRQYIYLVLSVPAFTTSIWRAAQSLILKMEAAGSINHGYFYEI
jgi:hypothetical protein